MSMLSKILRELQIIAKQLSLLPPTVTGLPARLLADNFITAIGPITESLDLPASRSSRLRGREKKTKDYQPSDQVIHARFQIHRGKQRER